MPKTAEFPAVPPPIESRVKVRRVSKVLASARVGEATVVYEFDAARLPLPAVTFVVCSPGELVDYSELEQLSRREIKVGKPVLRVNILASAPGPEDVRVVGTDFEIQLVVDALSQFYAAESDYDARRALRRVYWALVECGLVTRPT